MYLQSHGYSSSNAASRYKQPLSAVTVLRIHWASVASTPSNRIKHCPLARPVSITTQTRYQFLPHVLNENNPIYCMAVILKAQQLFITVWLCSTASCDNGAWCDYTSHASGHMTAWPCQILNPGKDSSRPDGKIVLYFVFFWVKKINHFFLLRRLWCWVCFRRFETCRKNKRSPWCLF